MSEWLKVVFVVLLLAALLLAVLGTGVSWRRASLPPEESLDHPKRSTRYYYRFWSWAVAYGLAMMISVAYSKPLMELLFTGKPPVLGGGLLFFTAPLPVAVLFFRLDRTLARWSGARIRAGRRRLGLRGYRVPVELEAPPIPVAFATEATQAQAPVRTISGPDMPDLELVREVAQKHWDAINFALASGGDVAAAQLRQQRFLDDAERELPAGSMAQLREVYATESATHAARMAGIARRQVEVREQQEFLRARARTNAVIIGAIVAALLVFGGCAKLLG